MKNANIIRAIMHTTINKICIKVGCPPILLPNNAYKNYPKRNPAIPPTKKDITFS